MKSWASVEKGKGQKLGFKPTVSSANIVKFYEFLELLPLCDCNCSEGVED